MNNQRQHWNQIHQESQLDHYSDPTEFVQEVLKVIEPNSRVLELGCGAGNDSIAFAKAGHQTLATDFSEVAINKNKERFLGQKNLNFETLDIAEATEFENSQFDIIYARLSLHYFDDKTTKRIFAEISRILKPNGLLAFICKSVDDPLYGKGEEIEKDMFEYKGHVRHFFSEEYAKECLGGLFEIKHLETGHENFYDSESAFVKVFAINKV